MTDPGSGRHEGPLEALVERFAAVVRLPEDQIPLDRAAMLVAAHARPDLEVDLELAELDTLAESCPVPTYRALHAHLFTDLGFRGDPDRYLEPESSCLDLVIRRRQGIPIALSVLCMEVGRRVGLRLAGVGMPGHFIVRHLDAVPPTWIDPFAGGQELDRVGCEERFHRVNGAAARFRDSYLEPTGPRAILGRMLANLRSIYATRANLRPLETVSAMRLAIPGVPATERRSYARVLAANGRFVEAASELEWLASSEASADKDAIISEATAMRARLN